jgi:hypothetical protein
VLRANAVVDRQRIGEQRGLAGLALAPAITSIVHQVNAIVGKQLVEVIAPLRYRLRVTAEIKQRAPLAGVQNPAMQFDAVVIDDDFIGAERWVDRHRNVDQLALIYEQEGCDQQVNAGQHQDYVGEFLHRELA